MAESRTFLDGNQRTGMAAALTFLRLNGRTIPRNTDELHAAMLSIAACRISKPELTALLRRLCVNA